MRLSEFCFGLVCPLALASTSVSAQETPAEAPATAAAVAAPSSATTAAKLVQAKALFQDLEYDKVIPLAQEILKDEGAPSDTRLDAYYLLGSSLAIENRASEAEQAFRFLLRGRPEFDLPPSETPPKILRVFRNVKVEEERIRAETRTAEHKRIVDSLKLSGNPPRQIIGGDSIDFRFQLRDPTGSVSAVHLEYRKTGSDASSTLALHLDPTGSWVGSIPSSWTENDDGFVVEYTLATTDANGDPLLVIGVPPTPPLRIDVGPGTIAGRIPVYASAWFWTGLAVAIIGGVTASVLVYKKQTDVPTSDLGALRLW